MLAQSEVRKGVARSISSQGSAPWNLQLGLDRKLPERQCSSCECFPEAVQSDASKQPLVLALLCLHWLMTDF